MIEINVDEYSMDFEARRDFVIEKMCEVLGDDTDEFVNICEELDNWNGFLGDCRCELMDMIDEFFSKPSDLLDRMDDFDKDDEYFYFDTWGVTTTSDKYDVYHDNFDEDEVIDALIENYNHVDIRNQTLKELLDIVIDEDFGIDEDVDIEYEMDDDDVPEETDDEFMDRINDLV